MKTKTIIIAMGLMILIIALAFLYSLSKNITGHAIEANKVKIGYLPVVQGLPVYMAIEKGYFKDAGLEVEAVKFDSPNQIVDALLQGNLDFGSPSTALGITGVADYKNPGKLKIYAVSGGTKLRPNENLMIPIDSNLSSIKDLKGKRLGILAGTIQWRTITREILAQNGLDMDKDVIIVELATPVQVQALASKQIDALLCLEPIPTIIKEKGIGKELIHGPAEEYISDPFYAGAGVVNVKFSKDNPKTTKKVIEIIDKTIDEINSDPNNARQYLKGYTSLDENLVIKAPMSIFKPVNKLTSEDKESIQKFYDIFTKYKVVDGKIEFEKMMYSM